MTAPLCALLLLTLGLAGGAIDAATGAGLRVMFAVLFIAGCAAVAWLARPPARRAVLVMPPLVYAVAASAYGGDAPKDGPWLTNHALVLLTSLITSAPALLTGTAVVAAITVFRTASGHRRPERVAGRPMPPMSSVSRPRP